jgi:D-alanyl-D-alanine carboxypeptidase
MRFQKAVSGALLLSLLAIGACSQTERADVAERAPPTNVSEVCPSSVIDVGGAERLPVPYIPAPATVLPRSALPQRVAEFPSVVPARAVLVFDDASGTALYESNSHDRLPPASLTKIATAVIVLETGQSLDTVVETHPDLERGWLEDSSSMGLEPGDRFSIRELLYGMLMVSGGDAARELAIATAGTESAFVDRMNGLAARLRLTDTHFSDVQGLDATDQFSFGMGHGLALAIRDDLPGLS